MICEQQYNLIWLIPEKGLKVPYDFVSKQFECFIRTKYVRIFT